MLSILSGFFVNKKNTIISIIIIGVVSFSLFYLNGLHNKIKTLESNAIKKEKEHKEEVDSLNNIISDKISIIAIRDVTISLKDNNINALKESIDIQNKEMEKYKSDSNLLNKKIEDYKKLDNSSKYIKKLDKPTCKELEDSINTIGRLKYEDL